MVSVRNFRLLKLVLVSLLVSWVVPVAAQINHWTFDETLEDAEGINHGVYVGAGEPEYVVGFDCTEKGAIRFDGSNYLLIDRTVDEEMTLACWMRADQTQAGNFFWEGSGLMQGDIGGECTEDMGFAVLGSFAGFGHGCPDVTVIGEASVVDGTWHHVAVVRDIDGDLGGENLRIYVDGILDVEMFNPSTELLTATVSLEIGRNLVGDLDDARIYDVALSDDDMENLVDERPPAATTQAQIRRQLSSDLLKPGDSMTVTLTATDVIEPFSVTETIPQGLTIANANGGNVQDNTVSFDITADGSVSYEVELPGNSCPQSTLKITGEVTTPGSCVTFLGSGTISCPGFIHHWTFDGTLLDEIGDNDAVFSGLEPTYVPGYDGEEGGAIHFDGIDSATVLPSVQDEMTLMCWVRADQTQPGDDFWEGSALMQGDVGGVCTGDLGFVILGSVVGFGHGCPDVTLVGETSIVDGTWHHVAAVRDIDADLGGEYLRIYVDGFLDVEMSTASTISLSAYPALEIGGDLVGDLDDARIYNFALSDEEILAISAPDCAEGQEVLVVTRDLSNDRIRVDGDPVTVTLTVTGVTDVTTVTDVFPDGLSVSASSGGDIDGNRISFEIVTDTVLSYEIEAGDDCSFQRGFFVGEVTPSECTTVVGAGSLRCIGLPMLVGHWKFDGTLSDELGENDATFTGPPPAEPNYVEGVDGEANSAIRFDGLDFVTVPPIVQDEMTLACWVRLDGPQIDEGEDFWEGAGLIQGEVDGPVPDVGLAILGDTAVFGHGPDDITAHAVTPVTDGKWHHVAGVRAIDETLDVALVRVYVDGRLEDEREQSFTGPLTANSVLAIGGDVVNNFNLMGDVDDVRFYNYALSNQELEELATPPGCESGVAQISRALPADVTPGDPFEVTLTVTEVTSPLTVKELFPAGLSVIDPGGGVVDGNSITFEITADGSLSYELGLPEDCPFAESEFTSQVTPAFCATVFGDRTLLCPTLVNHWTFDGTLEDQAGDNDGLFLGAGDPDYVSGFDDQGQGLRVDGNTYVEVAHTVQDELTWACWVRADQPQRNDDPSFWGGSGLIQGEVGGPVFDVGLVVLGNVAAFGHGCGDGCDDMTAVGLIPVTDGEWHHVSGVREIDRDLELSHIRVYVDGAFDGEVDSTYIGPLLDTETIAIGGDPVGGRFLTGDIDDVRFYNFALSDGDIQELAGGTVSGGFKRGDSNANGGLDIGDPILNLGHQFLGNQVVCRDALDFNDSGTIDISDPVANLSHQFLGLAPPEPPGKESCGPDPTDDPLDCQDYPQENC